MGASISRGKVVLCFGGEEKGLRHLTRERCDGLIGLPMRGHVESLNLATAAAAVLYEAVRQRTTGEGALRRVLRHAACQQGLRNARLASDPARIVDRFGDPPGGSQALPA